MRTSLIFIGIVVWLATSGLYAQTPQPAKGYDYQASWKMVRNLDSIGLPKSAIHVVDEIYSQAKKDKNAAQQVKSILYRINSVEGYDEDGMVKSIQNLKKEIRTSAFPVKPMLYSMLAERYWDYYQNNRYQFRKRSKTVEFKNDDIATWSISKIIEEVIINYQLSLQDADKLKTIKINLYDDVLIKGNAKGRAYRPTLFDFLAHRAVDMYMNDEPDIIKPAYMFTLNAPQYLQDAETFSKLPLTTKDTLSYKYYALKILQSLVTFHLKDNKPGALVDVDLKRLQFVYNHITLPNKQDLYLDALEKLEQKSRKDPVSGLVTYQIAQVWREQGYQFKPLLSKKHKWDIKKAYDLCDSIIKRFPKSDVAAMAFNLQQEIKTKSVSATMEKVNVPGMPFRALVTYRNLSGLNWKIIKVTRQEVAETRQKWARNYKVNQEEKFLEHFIGREPVKSGKVTLPNDNDFQQHSAEIKLDELPTGNYLVLFSSNPNFTLDKNAVNYAFTTISNISYIHRNLSDGSTDFLILDRTTGEPLEGAKAQVFFSIYNSTSRTYDLNPGEAYISDSAGFVHIPYQYQKKGDYNYNSFSVDFSWNNDALSMRSIDPQGYYGYYDYNSQVSQSPKPEGHIATHTLFFLDRSIYRPGQTIYFKGLLFRAGSRNPEIVPNAKQTVTFYDVNQQVVSRLDVTTNEYGTFSGTFTAPISGLTGQMSLMVNDNRNSRTYFSVEEYKRPKFEVKLNPVKGSFRLGESIQATGQAQAYSGANIDGARVKYRIVRRARYPWWWWSWYSEGPTSPEMEITNGDTVTDAEGRFSINFKAIPDESIDKASNPTFEYTVYADVTDINGETHDAQKSISVGYKALSLGVDIKDIDLATTGNSRYAITSTNLAGEPEPSKGVIRIWKLKNPAKAFRTRYWVQPDTFTISKDEYYQSFPSDQYADENNPLKWEKGSEIFKQNFNTSADSTFSIPGLSSWELGKYCLEITSTDKFGEPVKEFTHFNVDNTQSKALPYPAVNSFNEIKTSAEPGDTAKILVGSSEKINALVELEQDGKILEKQNLHLDNGKQMLQIPIMEKYRGNVAVHYTFVKNNRFYHETTTIIVPYNNKELNIAFETFRDKLQPGQQEQWKLKISGKNADKVMAEMVAGMYDASLDAFRPHNWRASFFSTAPVRLYWASQNGFDSEDFRMYERRWNEYITKKYTSVYYDALVNSLRFVNAGDYLNAVDVMSLDAPTMELAAEEKSEVVVANALQGPRVTKALVKFTPPEFAMEASEKLANTTNVLDDKAIEKAKPQIRKNFNETAFFYPHLQTNENGEIVINFTIPEALTRWKMMGFAHTKELLSGTVVKELVTQKDLMVVPNQPRFFRENDKMVFQVKVTSLSDKDLSGNAKLEFFDALTMKPVNDLMKNGNDTKTFSIKAKQSVNLEWNIEIPEGIQAVTYRVVAKAGNFSDGEEMTLPVVTNRMLVTETLPLPIRGNQTKEFRFAKLLENTSPTLRSQRFTLEFTSNPAWYAVQALPYLIEYPYECTEQTFSRYYANAIASHIANSNPKIKRVFDTWATIQPDALLSNLEKNQELKTALLEETPWVLNAKDESQRKRNIALLFDLNRMGNEMERALKKIMEAQLGNGGFCWFPGLPEDRYMTQHIIAGMGHLDAMGVKAVYTDDKIWNMVQKAIRYMDTEMRDHYAQLLAESKKGHLKMSDNHLDDIEIHYLYTRSYFKNIEVTSKGKEAFDYFMGQAEKYWLQKDIYTQGMVALALHRYGNKEVPAAIIKSLKERALHSDELGMYWKFNTGYYWYQAPIETQALMIEVFDEVAQDTQAVEDLKVWLLKQKQTQDWGTTKATSEACYALLRRGTDVLANDNLAEITVGNEKIDPLQREDIKVEAGTGYFKTAWTASEIKPEMGKITVSKKDDGVAWGAAYWQYFEQLDKITPAQTPLSLKKQLFLQKNTETGPVITPLVQGQALHVGDIIKVRVELRSDRNMEYIHLKDMRAAGFEPTETLSGYKYQDGLWYYQSPKDLATNFFIGWLPKGTYVFEYPLRVSQKGDFSNGITTIQCMYAPEFSSHSEGIRVKVE